MWTVTCVARLLSSSWNAGNDKKRQVGLDPPLDVCICRLRKEGGKGRAGCRRAARGDACCLSDVDGQGVVGRWGGGIACLCTYLPTYLPICLLARPPR